MSQPEQSPVLTREIVAGRTSPIVKLSANENPFGPSPKALAAMQASLPTLGLYPPSTDAALKEALAQAHGLDPEHFVTANGGCDVLKLAALSYLDKDSSILIFKPTFPIYALTAGQVGAEIIDAPLDSEFAFEPEAIRAALKPNTKVVYLCNPNNPTGTIFGQDTFDAILDAIPKDILIVYDEVYYHFATDKTLPDAKAAVRAKRNLLVIHSFSKAYGLAGLRIGYGLARPDITERLESQKNPFTSSTLALTAAEAALGDSEHVRRTVKNNTVGRALLTQTLHDMGLKVWPSQANFVLFEVPSTHTPQNLVEALQTHEVLVRPAFGLDNHLRVSVGLPEGNERFLGALKSSLV